MQSKNEIVLYQSDEAIQLEVRLENETVWLSQAQMAELFGCSSDNIGLHLKNLYEEGEIDKVSTTEDFSVVRTEGKRVVRRTVAHYNLDAILSVGYRVCSRNATLFRRWATSVLKDYILKGCAINQRIMHLEEKMDSRFELVEEKLNDHQTKIDFFVRTSLPPVEGVFYDGQVLEPFGFVNQLIRSATHRIVLIDNYVDDTVLLRLAERNLAVTATIYTQQSSPSFAVALQKNNAQYSPITVHQFTKSHDRFLIIDDAVYHIGASIKDLGKKWFAFCKMQMPATEILGRL